MYPKSLIAALLLLFLYSCNTQTINILSNNKQTNTALGNPHDMVLIYTGGSIRKTHFDVNKFRPYVSVENKKGTQDWLFDTFLFLELIDNDKYLYYYRGLDPQKYATKIEWKRVLENYFIKDQAISALDKQISNIKNINNQPDVKRNVVIAIPDPILDQKNWGEINGKTLDFANHNDRLNACKWYIDYAEKLFKQLAPQNLELIGFYWTLEGRMTHMVPITSMVADYLHKKKYKFYWIPYFNSQEYSLWREFGFDKAYLQPNYLQREEVTVDRLDTTINRAVKHGLGLEMELNNLVIKQWGDRAYRMVEYMDFFQKRGVWNSMDVAYFQGGFTLYNLFNSKDTNDNKLYYQLVNIVAERQKKFQL